MKLPILLTNFKTYEGATGDKALELARIHEKVAKDLDVNIAIAVQAVDIRHIASQVDIPVFAQHIDPHSPGAGTGAVLPEAVVQAGAVGTLLNHSECRIGMENIERSILRANEAGLHVIVCAEDVDEAVQIVGMNPDLIAVEPPELIGGDISVSTAKPEIIEEACDRIDGRGVLVGAGVKTGNDVKIALNLGAQGVLLASGVTKSADPEKALRDLAWGFKFE